VELFETDISGQFLADVLVEFGKILEGNFVGNFWGNFLAIFWQFLGQFFDDVSGRFYGQYFRHFSKLFHLSELWIGVPSILII